MVNVSIEDIVRQDLDTFQRVIGILGEVYKPAPVTPNMDTATIMYNAGQYSVYLNLKAVIDRVAGEGINNVI